MKIRLTVRNLSPYSEVRRPDGTLECGPGYGDIDDCPLGETGVHTVVVKDGHDSKTGSYALTLENLGSSTGSRTNDVPPPPDRGEGLDATQITVALIGALGTILAAVLATVMSARRRARARDE